MYDYTNKIWKDGDSAAPFYLHSSVPLVGTSFTITNPAHLHGFDTNSTEYFGFPNPYYEAPAVPQPTLVNTVSLTGGNWINFGFSYQHEATDATNTYYEYNMSDEPTNGVYVIAYNWTTKKMV